MPQPSILVVGAAGRLGLEIIRAADRLTQKPSVHAFVRTPSKIPQEDQALCSSVLQGDALISADLERALQQSQAKFVVLTIGIPNSPGKTDLREKSASALIHVIKPGGKYDDVNVVVVSSVGAGGSKLQFGWGLGTILAFIIRGVLNDHDNREKLFQQMFVNEPDFKKRVLIVRPTTLTLGTSRGDITVYEGQRPPTPWISREDLAKWILEEICSCGPSFGNAYNVTGL